MPDTEHDKDRLAYEACGYRKDEIADSFYDHIDDPGIVRKLAPWSSTDDAIKHAELGGFWWYVGRANNPFREADVLLPPETEVYRGTHETSPGIAIRNAILAWKERNP